MGERWWPDPEACVVGVAFLLTLCHGAPMVDPCEPTNCSMAGPVIRFPFRRRDQPAHCGYKGFELSCNGNATLVELPSDGRRFVIRSISYENQRLYLDPESCPLDTFLNLNLSNSPFELHDRIQLWERTFMLLNCTCEVPTTYTYCYDYAIRCLDGQGRHFFGVSAGYCVSYLNKTCISMRTQVVPLAFITGLCSGHDYDPNLVWGTPDCRSCKDGLCSFSGVNRQVTCVHTTGSGVSIGVFLFISALATIAKLYLSWKWKKDKETEDQMKIEKFLEECKALNPERYSYVDIKKITDQFKTKLGEGGYGSVYKGLLPSGIEVAVKVLIRTVGNVGEEFVNEVQTIGRIHHVNVVRLLGFCADGKNRALIYEFMPNESLEKFIFPKDRRGPPLGWAKLHEIAVGIARGIEYLHQGCDQRILHFDIKPHNILLDHNLTPKVSDFGLSKLCSKEQSVVSMTVARGTVGYIAPEVASRNVGNVSYKSDVYSFGMLLLEMVGGRKNVDTSVENTSQTYFPEWIYNHFQHDLELGLNIIEEQDANIARVLAVTALWCIQWYPVNRPSIKTVVQMLEGSVENLVIPPNPFVSTASIALDSKPRVHGTILPAISESETQEIN
ncbi:hypothetical protein Taro_012390 [Colocasia esculenta]|uniref:Protein kinase domain-containing protein n=1 Tax=Colocasia esculenta TaxID=4460 RepID=A0A843U8K8_COLES|nr:hypothetical protein [Colocasia esculenta]